MYADVTQLLSNVSLKTSAVVSALLIWKTMYFSIYCHFLNVFGWTVSAFERERGTLTLTGLFSLKNCGTWEFFPPFPSFLQSQNTRSRLNNKLLTHSQSCKNLSLSFEPADQQQSVTLHYQPLNMHHFVENVFRQVTLASTATTGKTHLSRWGLHPYFLT